MNYKNRKNRDWQIILIPMLIVAALISNNALAQDFTAWQDYDFTPGDTVIFYDDFSADELGAFPEVWDQISGECEIVAFDNMSWLVATEDSEVDPYMESSLPPAFAVEFTPNILRNGKPGHWAVTFLDAAKNQEAEFSFDAQSSNFMTPSGSATSFEQSVEGRQHIAIMFQDGRFKCYIGSKRVLDVGTGAFKPASVRLGMFVSEDTPNEQVMFTNFRITGKRAEPEQLLYEKKRWVCYGIYFDFGAATLRGESYPTLLEIGELFKRDPRLNLSIEDHSNDKEDDGDNARLSQDRAEALEDYFMETFNLTKDRIKTKAWGPAKPLQPNDTPDGWEMNRRVELIKF